MTQSRRYVVSRCADQAVLHERVFGCSDRGSDSAPLRWPRTVSDMINVESTVREVTGLSLAVRRELERRVAIQSRQARSAPLEALVLRHGCIFYQTVAPTVHQIAPPGERYRAALRVCLRSTELTYCVGYTTAEDMGGVILPDAWAATREGVVVDPT